MPRREKTTAPSEPLADPRREAFCHAYLKSYELTSAAIEAGFAPKSAHVSGHNQMQRPEVQARIAYLKGIATPRVQIEQDDVLRGWMQIAMADIRDVVEWGMEEVLGEDGLPMTLPNGEIIMRPFITARKSHDLPRHISAGVAEVSMSEKGVFKVKMHDKLKALDSLARHLGLFKEDNDQVGAAAAGTVAALIAQAQGTPLPIATRNQPSGEE